jgi:hypothetical protein
MQFIKFMNEYRSTKATQKVIITDYVLKMLPFMEYIQYV